jgi:hypothetical protein
MWPNTSAARSTAWQRNQCRRPSWVVEDDGSTDETPVILKMDLPVRYFELRMLQRMESDPRVGS